MTCGNCKHCKANDICNGDHICEAKGIEVSQDDDTSFYGNEDNKPCDQFEKAD